MPEAKKHPKAKLLLLVCCLLGWTLPAPGQPSLQYRPGFLYEAPDLQLPPAPANWSFFTNSELPDQPPLPLHLLLPLTEPDAFFCRIEWQLEKSTALPVRFRLGSVDYVDWLEGKNQWWRPD